MSTYATVRAQIEKLEARAKELRAKEVAGVVAEIKQRMAEYGLTAEDLGLRATRGAKGVKAKGVPKYRDPESGRTWTGHGKPPNWIAGKDREAFLIDGASTARRSMRTAVKAAVKTRGKPGRKPGPKPAAKRAKSAGRKADAAQPAASA